MEESQTVNRTSGLNNTTILSRSGVVVGLNKSFRKKKKMHKLVPTISEKSKAIDKGKSYTERINRRKAVMYGQMKSTKLHSRSQGASNISAKHVNEKKYLERVPGMALTKAQKK